MPRKFPISKAHVDPVMAENVCDSMSEKEMCVRFSVAISAFRSPGYCSGEVGKIKKCVFRSQIPFFQISRGETIYIYRTRLEKAERDCPHIVPLPI